MSDEKAKVSAPRPFSAPDGTWPRDQWPVDVVRTDASGEVDLAHLEYNLSLTPAERIAQLQGWLNFIRIVRESGGAQHGGHYRAAEAAE